MKPAARASVQLYLRREGVFMQSKLRGTVLLSLLLIFPALSAAPAAAQKMAQDQPPKTKPAPKQLTEEELYKRHLKGVKPPSGLAFYVAPITETPGRFSVLLSSADNQAFVSGIFSLDQLVIFEAIAVEAQKFAENSESVGLKKAIVTRFFDKNEPAFVVDVAKVGRVSRFYVTLKGLTQQIMVEAGEINRGEIDREVKPFYFDIISRLDAAKSGRYSTEIR
jgi:hypothetical protein